MPASMASMGPRSSERGDFCAILWFGVRVIASMGPRSSERGDVALGRDAAVDIEASMGPRSSERGDAVAKGWRSRVETLQWGRAPRSAEINILPSILPAAEAASMGPRSSERGDSWWYW